MTSPRIFVTGATGKIGGALARNLAARGMTVRALVRRTDERSKALEQIGIETVKGDLGKSDDLRRALAGVDRAFFSPPFSPTMGESARVFRDVAAEAGIQSVTVLSQWIASPDHPSAMSRMHWRADAMFAEQSRFKVAFVAPGYFADNYLRFTNYAAHLGLFPNLTGDSRNAPPSNEDIAAVAAETLMHPDAHHLRRYRPTGPDLLSGPEIAQIMSTAVGRRVLPIPLPFWLLSRAARMQGVPIFDIESLRWYIQDHRQGAFAFAGPTDHVFKVTGRAPEPFAAIARRYAAMPEFRRGWSRELRAWLAFLATPFAPPYALDRFARDNGLLPGPHPVFAAASEQWRTLAAAVARQAQIAQP